MCGITGIYGLSDRKLIKRMTDTLKHRGPDGEGYYVDETVSLGHRRLSIIDLKTGSQPIYNEDGSIIVVYNGEIYNYKSLRSDLEKKRGKGKKHSFCSTSDTEVLVHLYEEHGEDFIETLNGIFAFALYDSNKRKLLIARDRIGIKPLYYVRLGSKLLFSSEIKSILQYDGVKREIDKEGLSSYLTYGSVLGEQTMFKSIKKLQPGHLLTYDGKNLVIKKYYKRKEEISYYNEDLAAKRLRSLLEKSVDSQLMSDVPLGAFLSGGVDSSTIVGIMSGIMKRPVETFTVGFGREDDELKYARITSEHFSTKHHEIMVYPKDVPPIISKLVWHYDDLIWDAASVPTYFVSELAKKHVKVVLTGEGGDELFGGYNRYKPFSPYFWFVPSFFKKKAYDMFSQLFDPWIRLQVLGNYPSRYSEEIENEYFRKTKGLKSILDFEKEQLLPNQLLNKVDKASMAASIEARVPFLDNTIVEFADSIPISMKMKGFTGKTILRKATSDLVPPEIIKRKKQGFGASALQWFKEKEMRDYALNILDKPHISKELGFPEVRDMLDFNKIRKGRRAYQLWSLLELEIWYRTFIEKDGKNQVRI